MPRKIELTWQDGSGKRRGRWRKKYKGTVYYFAFGRSKSDKDGYDQALAVWKIKKAEIDEEEEKLPRDYEEDYRRAIEEWTLALQWSREHGDSGEADRARRKIDELTARLKRKSLPRLSHYDLLANQHRFPPEILDSLGASLALSLNNRSNDVLGESRASRTSASDDSGNQCPAIADDTAPAIDGVDSNSVPVARQASGAGLDATSENAAQIYPSEAIDFVTTIANTSSCRPGTAVLARSLATLPDAPISDPTAHGATDDAVLEPQQGNNGGTSEARHAMPKFDLGRWKNGGRCLVVPDSKALASMDGSQGRIAAEIWADRIEAQRRKNQGVRDTVNSCIKTFLDGQRERASIGQLSAGRCEAIRVHLNKFEQWIGGSLPVTAITGKVLKDYHATLLAALLDETISRDYATDVMRTVISFVRWLWRNEVIESLPRVVGSRDLVIGELAKEPPVFTIEEVKTLLGAATNRTRLYLLLMLNCGATQKDISDLRPDEVDWRAGTLRRKRSKTRKHEGVPTVTYRLWAETLQLLRDEHTPAKPTVLVNSDGGRLKVEKLQAGKLKKIDNIASAFKRLQSVTSIKKPLKLFRKTSASLLGSNKEFAAVAELFLGHAPDSIATKHYVQAPQQLLDEAIAWLRHQYGVSELFKT